MGQHQRGPLHLLDDLGHGKGLAGSGNAQQHLLLQPVLDALRQRGNGLRLVPGGLIFRYDFKFRHSGIPSTHQTDFQPRPSYHTRHLFATFVRLLSKEPCLEKSEGAKKEGGLGEPLRFSPVRSPAAKEELEVIFAAACTWRKYLDSAALGGAASAHTGEGESKGGISSPL